MRNVLFVFMLEWIDCFEKRRKTTAYSYWATNEHLNRNVLKHRMIMPWSTYFSPKFTLPYQTSESQSEQWDYSFHSLPNPFYFWNPSIGMPATLINKNPSVFRNVSPHTVMKWSHSLFLQMFRRAYCDSYLELQNVNTEVKKEVCITSRHLMDRWHSGRS